MRRSGIGLGCCAAFVALASSAPAAAALPHSVYVANYSDATLSTFAVGAAGGLTQQGPNLTTGPSGPNGLIALAMTPNGQYLFGADFIAGTIETFAVGAGGKLTPEGQPVPSLGGMAGTQLPTSLVVSPNGQNLYVTNYGDEVSTFSIGAGGALTLQGTVNSGICCASEPEGVAIAPSGQYVYVANASAGTVSTFAVGAGGALTQQGTGVITGAGASSRPWSLVVSPNGQYLFVANRGLGTVSTFTIGAGGALTQQGTGVISGSDAHSGVFALAVTPNGNNLYAANSGHGTVSTFTIGAGGALTQQGTGSLTTGSNGSYPDGVAVSGDGRHLYAVNGEFANVTTFAIGAGGALRREQIVRSGTSPDAVVVSPAQSPAPTSSKTATIGNQRVTLTTPPASVCQGAGGALAVRLSAKAAGHGARLRFSSVAFYVEGGVGRKHAPNAVATKLPATEQLPLAARSFGPQKLTVKLTYARGTRTVTRTIKFKFTICAPV